MRHLPLIVALGLLPSCGLYRSVLENSENIKGAVSSIAEMVADGKDVFEGIKVTASEMKTIYAEADKDGDGKLSMEEILLMLGGGGIVIRNMLSGKKKEATNAEQAAKNAALERELAVVKATVEAKAG